MNRSNGHRKLSSVKREQSHSNKLRLYGLAALFYLAPTEGTRSTKFPQRALSPQTNLHQLDGTMPVTMELKDFFPDNRKKLPRRPKIIFLIDIRYLHKVSVNPADIEFQVPSYACKCDRLIESSRDAAVAVRWSCLSIFFAKTLKVSADMARRRQERILPARQQRFVRWYTRACNRCSHDAKPVKIDHVSISSGISFTIFFHSWER